MGAKIVARAWTDAGFRSRLLADGRAACEEMGITFYDDTGLIVLENTEQVHNLIVCTLCSCYPRPVLGLPPDWYKAKPYRARAVIEPRALLAEFGTIIPNDVEIRVSDSTAQVRYLVLPLRPSGTEGFDEAATRLPGHPRCDDWRHSGRPSLSRTVSQQEIKMNPIEELVKRLPNDIGGVDVERFQRVDHPIEPWEKRCHALADVLDFHKIINTEEKRRGVEALGSEMVAKLTYYQRWIVVFANILFQKQVLTPDQLAVKMAEVEATRHDGENAMYDGPFPSVKPVLPLTTKRAVTAHLSMCRGLLLRKCFARQAGGSRRQDQAGVAGERRCPSPFS